MFLVPRCATVGFAMSLYCFGITVQMSPNNTCVAIVLEYFMEITQKYPSQIMVFLWHLTNIAWYVHLTYSVE